MNIFEKVANKEWDRTNLLGFASPDRSFRERRMNVMATFNPDGFRKPAKVQSASVKPAPRDDNAIKEEAIRKFLGKRGYDTPFVKTRMMENFHVKTDSETGEVEKIDFIKSKRFPSVEALME